MFLDEYSLEEFRENNYDLYHFVVDLLNENENWKKIVSALSQYRIRLCLPAQKIRKMETSHSPAEELFNILIMRACMVRHLKELLRFCDLTDVLAYISDPEKLEITVQPGEEDEVIHVCYNDVLTLKCQAIGLPPPKYQWFVDNVPLENQTNPTLSLPEFSLENEGDYYCEVSQKIGDDFDQITSNSVTVCLMDLLPEFLQQPPLKIVQRPGSDLNLIVEVACKSRYNLQWMCNNSILPEQNSNTLTITNLTKNHSGAYRCRASNSGGEVYTLPTELIVDGESIQPSAKVALLIANSKYEHFDNLSTPVNDVILLNEKLTQLKFKVITLMNLSLVEMQNTISWFFRLTPPGSYAIVCFVGHGFMLSNCKYMMPVDCPPEYRVQDSICDEILVKEAKENKLRFLLLILDMCLTVPNSEDNPQIFHERAPDYIYTCNGECHVVRASSTSSHQKAYENPSRVNGFYIKHLSKYLTLDRPIGKIFFSAHNDFEEHKLIKIQKPMVNFDGGYKIKLTDKAIANEEFLARFEAVNQLSNIHELNFSQIGFKTNLYVVPHKKKILNAVDLHFSHVFLGWGVTVHVSPPGRYQLESKHNEDGSFVLTLFDVQKAKSDIFITVLLSNVQKSSVNPVNSTVANAVLDLGLPLFATANVWCENNSVRASLN